VLYQLSYAHHRICIVSYRPRDDVMRPYCSADVHILARPAGLEPATAGLEGRCSIRLSYRRLFVKFMVGVTGFEPVTYCSQSSCATRLRYTPML
jgi:hypothetical protein